VKADGSQFLNTPSAPAHAGDALVIYCTGLGAVAPAVPAGAAAPSLPLSRTVNPVTVTIGTQSAQPFYAGLTPGYSGLYQVNVIVPAGIAAGANVPVVLSAGGALSPPVTIAVQ
jgi:adhesin/invasin